MFRLYLKTIIISMFICVLVYIAGVLWQLWFDLIYFCRFSEHLYDLEVSSNTNKTRSFEIKWQKINTLWRTLFKAEHTTLVTQAVVRGSVFDRGTAIQAVM
jgi:hypothetical protein